MGGCAAKQQSDSRLESQQQQQQPTKSIPTEAADADAYNDNNNSYLGSDQEYTMRYKKYLHRPLPAIETPAQAGTGLDSPMSDSAGSGTARLRPEPGVEVVAMFDYSARTQGELTFRAGDALCLLDAFDSDWWLVEHRQSGDCGYVPVALVAVQHSLQAHGWYFGRLSRKEAERLLLAPGNCRGAFLLRKSESHAESYSLSVLDILNNNNNNNNNISSLVKHYRVRLLDHSMGCYISSRRKFSSPQALIANYSNSADGLCCRLQVACKRHAPTMRDLSFDTRDRWEICRDQLQLQQKLGAGQFGEVWRGIFNGATEVAVKMLKAGCATREEFLKEAKIMKKLRHPKLVQLFAVCTDGDPVYIVTELMQHGSLLDFLRKQDQSLQVLMDLAAQVASGMAYLESQQFVHRDLAARNILVGDNNVAKVADFGLSRAISDSSGEYLASHGAKFPIKWTSPEAALLGKFSIKSDVWSFGIVLFETLTHGQVPYASMSNTETLQAVDSGYRLPQPPLCPVQLYDIMLSCWNRQAELRPTFSALRDFLDDFFLAAESGYRCAEAQVLIA